MTGVNVDVFEELVFENLPGPRSSIPTTKFPTSPKGSSWPRSSARRSSTTSRRSCRSRRPSTSKASRRRTPVGQGGRHAAPDRHPRLHLRREGQPPQDRHRPARQPRQDDRDRIPQGDSRRSSRARSTWPSRSGSAPSGATPRTSSTSSRARSTRPPTGNAALEGAPPLFVPGVGSPPEALQEGTLRLSPLP